MSKLTQRQWANIERAVLRDGESMRAVADRYGVDEAAIRRRLAKAKTEMVEDAAIKLAEAERDIKALKPVDRIRARSLAEMLTEMSHTMSEVAELGMRNALKLTQIKAQRIDALMPSDIDALKEVVLLGDAANKASKLGVDLMTVGKQSLIDADKKTNVQDDVMQMAPINMPALVKS
jgi:transposase-like protein